jgi:hypothetical protein
MPSEIAKQDATLFALTDDLSAYFESREMIVAQLAEPLEPVDADPLKAQLAEIDAHLATLGAELATKTDNIAGVLRRMATEQDWLKAEQERIHARRKTFERAEKWLRDYVVSVMQSRDLTQLKTPANTLFLRQSDAVIVTDGEAVPDAYKNATVKMPARTWHAILGVCASFAPAELCTLIEAVRPTEDISLSAIKKAIKSGVTVDGADVEFHDSLVLR